MVQNSTSDVRAPKTWVTWSIPSSATTITQLNTSHSRNQSLSISSFSTPEARSSELLHILFVLTKKVIDLIVEAFLTKWSSKLESQTVNIVNHSFQYSLQPRFLHWNIGLKTTVFKDDEQVLENVVWSGYDTTSMEASNSQAHKCQISTRYSDPSSAAQQEAWHLSYKKSGTLAVRFADECALRLSNKKNRQLSARFCPTNLCRPISWRIWIYHLIMRDKKELCNLCRRCSLLYHKGSEKYSYLDAILYSELSLFSLISAVAGEVEKLPSMPRRGSQNPSRNSWTGTKSVHTSNDIAFEHDEYCLVYRSKH